jgi:hypothetical protein
METSPTGGVIQAAYVPIFIDQGFADPATSRLERNLNLRPVNCPMLIPTNRTRRLAFPCSRWEAFRGDFGSIFIGSESGAPYPAAQAFLRVICTGLLTDL